MASKLFISYSHKDESYREEFVKYLTNLKREGLIEDWHDRKILAGQEWERELIDLNLTNSHVIVFLVSQDFIASKYCLNVEVKKAMEMHEQGEAVVIPVILRHCDWTKTPFSILEACPEKGVPIKAWDDVDKAWLNVTKKIRDSLTQLKLTETVECGEVESTNQDGLLSDEFVQWLDDTEIGLHNSTIDRVSLREIYVAPHLNYVELEADDVNRVIDGEELARQSKSMLIFGDEQSGKTSLCKHLIREFLDQGINPIFINGKLLDSSDPKKVIQTGLSGMYKSLDAESFEFQENKILIIDDFNRAKLNQKYLKTFVERSLEIFDQVILLASEAFQYISKEVDAFGEFSLLEVMSFGHKKRATLIQRWICLGKKESMPEAEMYEQLDAFTVEIDSFIKGNIVPAKPFYLLTVLQMKETFRPSDRDKTTSGHCYEYLILMALEKTGIRAEQLDTMLNVLTELAWYSYKRSEKISATELKEFFNIYEKKFLLKIQRHYVIKILVLSRLIRQPEDEISFRYPYIYYYFVAKYIADNIADNPIMKTEVTMLLDSINREDCSNIIIFISHHSRNKWILDQIQKRLIKTFESFTEATLSSESVKFLNDFVQSIPEPVIEQKEISGERRKLAETKDKESISSQESETDIDEEYLEVSETYIEISRVIKGIEIVGQIVRNRHGSIQREDLEKMIQFATDAGLRFLQFFLEINESSHVEIIQMIEQIVSDDSKIKTEKLQREAKHFYEASMYSAIGGIVRKIASSIGSKEAETIYKKIGEEVNTPAVQLINQCIDLQFGKVLDFKKLKQLNTDFQDNLLCSRMLQDIVVQHIYMFPLNFKDKQRASEALNIGVKGQVRLQQIQSAKKY